ncbi:hypothetical protein [Nonomuraea cavernae]|uniref:Uncharacterized protein n=1 Tax=Nonomuraea cavernae TaxID=2045107 RepID=A0A918DF24_9ACTN|nr:hypothetical protein [Nonomuraea cavernae]MCA2184697.1 hypothetical protein [Nonomuraea cavernae]GGO63032.1 hypothetical protein GCM10012289_09000 [Nonomuraea cavernae]
MNTNEDRKYGTPYVETEIVAAMTVQDVDHVRALLAQMLPGERRALEHRCMEIAGMIQVMREEEE